MTENLRKNSNQPILPQHSKKPRILRRSRNSAPSILNTPQKYNHYDKNSSAPISVSKNHSLSYSPQTLPRLSTPQIETTPKKPPYSYAAIIEMALCSAPHFTMNLKDIYLWIENNFEYFKTAKSGWKNSIRHNLSLQKTFLRVDVSHLYENPHQQPSIWTLKIDENRQPLTLQNVKAREKFHTSTPIKQKKNLNSMFFKKSSSTIKNIGSYSGADESRKCTNFGSVSPIRASGYLTPNRRCSLPNQDSGTFSLNSSMIIQTSKPKLFKTCRKTRHELLIDSVSSSHVLDVSSSSSSNCSPEKYFEKASKEILPLANCNIWINDDIQVKKLLENSDMSVIDVDDIDKILN